MQQDYSHHTPIDRHAMKRILSLTIVILAACGQLMAQNTSGRYWYPCPGCDTIDATSERYYRTEWYDTCYYFRHPEVLYPGGKEECDTAYLGWRRFWDHTFSGPPCSSDWQIMVKYNHFPGRLAVKGLVALISNYSPENTRYLYDSLQPEYMHLWTGAPGDSVGSLLDSIRWDTAQPMVLRFNMTPYYDTFTYCFAYEAYFKTPYVMDTTFWISGTNHSFASLDPYSYITTCRPWEYIDPQVKGPHYENEYDAFNDKCNGHRLWGYFDAWGGDVGWVWLRPWDGAFGYYLPIVGYYWDLNVLSDSTDLGTVEGGGRLPDMSWDTIRAIPSFGYEFAEWNDGSTENPRVIYLWSDTTFTARFAELNKYELQLGVNNPLWGSVEGQGRYPQDYTLTVSAVPRVKEARFVAWDDGDTNNPRQITMTRDSSITAIFAHDSTQVGVEDADEGEMGLKLSPNPVRNMLRVKTGHDVKGTLSIYNSNGVRLINYLMEGHETRLDVSGLPEGQYLLILTAGAKQAHGKFVKR